MHRHPGDLIRMLLAATLLVLSVLAVQRGHLSVVERDVFRLVNDLPDVLIVLFWPVMQLGTRFAPYVLGTVAAVATVLNSLGLYQVTHHWAGPQRAGTTELTVQVSVKDRALRTVPMVEAAGRYCALNSGAGANYESVERESRDTALLHLTPSLDQAAQDRYVGCVEDTLLDRTQLEVTSVRSTPVRFVVDPR